MVIIAAFGAAGCSEPGLDLLQPASNNTAIIAALKQILVQRGWQNLILSV
jgi:hypothetical protein